MSTTDNPLAPVVPALYVPESIVEVRRVPRYRGEGEHARSTWHVAADLPAAYESLLDDNGDGWDIYFGVNPRPKVGARGDKCIAVAHTVFADFDDTALAVALERITAAGLPAPTLIINSGHGIHVYWRLVETVTDLGEWARIQRRLIAALGSDPRIFNPERLMRLPGFLNIKRTPFTPCYVVECEPGRRYTLASVHAILDAKGIPADTNAKPVRSVTPEQLRKAKASGAKGDSVIDQFNDAYGIAAVLEAHGYTEAGHARMNRPGGTTAGVHLIDGLSFHFSSNDPLNDGKFGYFSYHDPFSAFCLLAHAGNVSKAVRAAAKLMGIEHKDETQHTEKWHQRRRNIRSMAQRVAQATEAA